MNKINERLDYAIKAISSAEIKVVDSRPVRGGINSNVFKLTDSIGTHYALKLYPDRADKNKTRIESEIRFLHFLEKIGSEDCSKLIREDVKHNWCLLKWINGDKIDTITPIHIKKIALFIALINKNRNTDASKAITYAEEPCISIDTFTNGITRKFNLVLNSHTNKKESELIALWLKTTLKPHLNYHIQKLKEKQLSAHWLDRDIGSWLSPSDVGIHNMIENQNQIYFLDFEYAGKDDLSKLVADWILQPNAPFSRQQECLFISSLYQAMETYKQKMVDVSWFERFRDIKSLIHIKWCLIMLKDKGSRVKNYTQFQKTKSYFAENMPHSN